MEKFHMFFWPLVILGIFFIVSFFLSLSETALIAVNKIRLRHMAETGRKNARTAQGIVSHLDRLITTILIGNNIVNTAISVIGAAILIYFFGQKWGMLISTAAISFLILVFCEITPKLFAAQHPERVSLFMAGPMKFMIVILRPIVTVFMAMGNFLVGILGGHPKTRIPLITEEEMRLMIEVGKEEGAVSDDERRMLHRIFEFGDTLAGDVMVPREKIAAVPVDATPEQLLDILVEEGHSRIPVYKTSPENITGIIYARDLLNIWHNKGLIIIPDLIQPAYFVKKNKKVGEVLKDFQRMKIQIAIVVDDNKKAIGLVTLENLIEEIVGELEEEV